jgi:methyl-accepting chemotaxis protein
MAHRADEIRRDIEGTRAAMTEKVGMVVERAQEQMEAVKSPADRAMTGFRQVQETVEGAKSTTNTVEECERRMEAIRAALQRVEALIDYCARVRAALQSLEAAEKRLAFEASDIRVAWTPGQRPGIQGSIPIHTIAPTPPASHTRCSAGGEFRA